MPAAVLLFGVLLAYVVYIWRAGLARRIRPDRARLTGLFRGGQARWTAINIIFTWVLLLTLLLQLVTGCMIYLGYGGRTVELHWFGTWMLIAGAAVHIATHLAIGGVRQLTRIFKPSRLPPLAPPFDPFDLIADARRSVERPPQRRGSRDAHTRNASRREVTLKSHPFAVAMAVGLVGMTVATIFDQTAMRDTLYIARIPASAAPVLDGDLADPAWRLARPITVLTNQGANFDGTGSSEVEIRAVHDGETAYFSFIWSDFDPVAETPSADQEGGWLARHAKRL